MSYILKMSSKGQITLPMAYRKRKNCLKGDRFVVLESKKGLLIKKLESKQKNEDLLQALSQNFAEEWLSEEDELAFAHLQN